MDISTLMRTLGSKTGLFRMHRPADVGVPGGLNFLCAVKVHFTSGCKSRPRNCRCTSVAIGRGHGTKATVVLEAPRQKASERGLSKHAGRNASEA